MRIFQIIIHIFIWAFSFYLMAPAPIGWGEFDIGAVLRPEHSLWFFCYGFLLNILLFYSYAHLALPIYLKNKSFRYFFLINLAYLLGFTLLESFLDLLYQRHIFANHVYNQDLETFESWLTINGIFNGLALIAANFYGFSFAFLREQGHRRRLEKEKLKAELSALKHQVNPHFLFNVLNSLYGLSLKNDDEETATAIMQLSEMMRYMLYEANDDTVSLQKEIDYLNNYIELQRLRVNEQTHIRFEVMGEVKDKQIAPMMMIPFVENACKHGVSTVFPSQIDILIKVEEGMLYLEVSNPVHPRNGRLGVKEGGIGLQNVYKRLQLYYPHAHKLSIQNDGKTYEVSLTLNL